MVLAFLVACGGEKRDGDVFPAQQTTNASELNSTCTMKEGTPLRVDTVLGVLRNHGYSMYVVTDPVCGAGMVAKIANVQLSGPNVNNHDADRIMREEGHVICNIGSEILLRGNQGRTVQRFTDDVGEAAARFYLGNVDCSIYPDSEKGGEQVASLEAAMHSLEREIGQ
jgi:hypothetical protein